MCARKNPGLVPLLCSGAPLSAGKRHLWGHISSKEYLTKCPYVTIVRICYIKFIYIFATTEILFAVYVRTPSNRVRLVYLL